MIHDKEIIERLYHKFNIILILCLSNKEKIIYKNVIFQMGNCSE